MNYTEFTGKTVEEAVEKGLKELGLTKETAVINVLEEGKRKLFGSIKARVEIAPLTQKECSCKEEAEEKIVVENTDQKTAVNENGDGARAVAFLEGLLKILNVEAQVELVSESEKVEINVKSNDTTAIIGKRGVMLDALQTLAGAVANTGRDEYRRVVVDCENYRDNRENTLTKLAGNLAQKAIRLGKKIKLEPMNPYERRIIHAALSEIEGVKTVSEGKEPNRYIVVIPENLEDENAPAIPARNDRGGRDNYRGNRGGNRGGYRNNNRGGKDFKKPYNGGNKKPYAKRSGSSSNSDGTTLKNMDFFGTFLGNSNKD